MFVGKRILSKLFIKPIFLEEYSFHFKWKLLDKTCYLYSHIFAAKFVCLAVAFELNLSSTVLFLTYFNLFTYNTTLSYCRFKKSSNAVSKDLHLQAYVCSFRNVTIIKLFKKLSRASCFLFTFATFA